MTDPILIFLTADLVGLLLLGSFSVALPLAVCALAVTTSCGLGLLACLPPLLFRLPATALDFPIGPPGLALHLALDPLSAFLLAVVLLTATGIAAFQTTNISTHAVASLRMTAFCIAGTTLSLLAADGVTLAIGLGITCIANWLPGNGGGRGWRADALLLVPLLLLIAVCVVTPPGFAPRFDTVRAAPVDPNHATAAAALTVAAFVLLIWSRAGQRHPDRHEQDGHALKGIAAASDALAGDALAAGILLPLSCYLLLRVVADLSGAAAQTGCGFILLLAGGSIAVLQAWCSCNRLDIDHSVGCLVRRQAGLVMAGAGLALVDRAADLPGAASFALAATLLSVIGGSVAGVLTTLAAHTIGFSAGTYRLSRLGGLVHAMPRTSAALAIGFLGLSALPPGIGFASLWLLFESILSAPRSGGLLSQLPLALAAAALALSAALATAASVRLLGVALLGRPRTPLGARATEGKVPFQIILLILAGLSGLSGILPGALLWTLADPAIRALSGALPAARLELTSLLSPASSPSYLALPVLGLLALTTGVAIFVSRRPRKEAKTAGLWADGMAPPVGLPFGEPAAQPSGDGFLPAHPDLALPRMPDFSMFAVLRPPSAAIGMWLVLASFSVLLLVLAIIG